MAIVRVQKGEGGEDGFQNGFQEVAKTVQDRAKMGQDAARREKMNPKNVAIAGRFAAVVNLEQSKSVVEQKWKT